MRTILRAYRDAYSGLPRATWLVAMIALVNRSGTMVLPFLTLYLTERREFEPNTAGVFVAVYGIGAFLGTLMGGRLTDRLGPVPVQIGSLLTAATLFFCIGYFADPILIGCLLFLLGLFGEAFRPASATLVASTCSSEQRTRAYALQRLAVNLGMAIGPAIGGVLATVGYLWLFWVDGITCLLAAFLLYHYFGNRETRNEDSETQGVVNSGPLQDRIMILTMLLTLLIACVFFQLFSTVPLYLKNAYGMNKAEIGALLAINPVIIVAVEMLLVRRLQHMNPLRPMGIGALCVGLGFGLLPWGSTWAFAILSLLIWTLGEMLESPLLAGFVSGRANSSNRGRYMATMGIVFSTAMIVAPAMGTAIYQRYGGMVLWTGSALIGALACIGYQLLARVVDRESARDRDSNVTESPVGREEVGSPIGSAEGTGNS